MTPGCTKRFVRLNSGRWIWELVDATGRIIGRSFLEFETKAEAGLNIFAHAHMDEYPECGLHNDTPKVA